MKSNDIVVEDSIEKNDNIFVKINEVESGIIDMYFVFVWRKREENVFSNKGLVKKMKMMKMRCKDQSPSYLTH